MRLSTILELLLIFLLIAFAAYGRVIEDDRRAIGSKSTKAIGSSVSGGSLKQTTETVNKYCVCNENICNCCRDFLIPIVKFSGPGCASLQYLGDEKLGLQLSIGDNILTTNVVNGKSPKPVCVALPGGYSKFCGKIYSIKREADKHFKACLGLELRSSSELEASLRVSCFRFGPDGLKLRPAEPLPAVAVTETSTIADDDYDIFGLDDEDDDDEDDEDDDAAGTANNEPVDQDQDSDTEQEEDDEDDILGFGALLDIFTGDDESSGNKKPKVTTPLPIPPSFAIPILPLTTPKAPTAVSNESPAIKPVIASEVAEPVASIAEESPQSSVLNAEDQQEPSESSTYSGLELETIYPLEETTKNLHKISDEGTTLANDVGVTEIQAESNNVLETNKITTKITDKVKFKKTKVPLKKKIALVSPNVNVNKYVLKPKPKPTPQEPPQQSVTVKQDQTEDYELDDDDDDDDNDDDDDSDEEFEESEEEQNTASEQSEKDESEESEKQEDDEEAEILNDDDDYEEDEYEEEEEEDAVLSALIDDGETDESGNKNKKSKDKTATAKPVNSQKSGKQFNHQGLAELLSRTQQQIRTTNEDSQNVRKTSRQSKVMRL